MANPVEDLINRIYAEQSSNGGFDAQLAAAIDQARLNLADVNRAYGRGTEEANINYDEMARNLLRSRDEGYQTNSGNFAGRGLLRSGIFATEQGKIGDAYQRDLTSAAQRRTSTLENLVNQQLSGYNQIQGYLRGEQGGAIERAQQRQAEQAQRDLEAQYQQQQLEMQQQQMQQQIALAKRSGGGGGGGGGGGFYTLDQLFPGMFDPQPAPAPAPRPYESLKKYAGGGGGSHFM